MCVTICRRFRPDEGAVAATATEFGQKYRKVGRADCGNNFSNRLLFTPFIATRFAMHRNHAFAWFRAAILGFSVNYLLTNTPPGYILISSSTYP
ncbi:MAG: hypothetical protein ACLTZM_03885 [Ruminococcus sp.]